MARDLPRLSAQDWRHLATAGAVTLGVLGTLVLGAVLRAGATETPLRNVAGVDRGPRPGEAAAPPTAAESAPAIVATTPDRVPAVEPREPTPAPEASPRTGSLANRPQTAAPGGAGWTLQFMVTCTAETTQRLRNTLGGDPRLQLLPVDLDGRRCQRVCWGAYATRDEAIAPQRFPAALAAINAEPIPRRVTDLLR